MTDLIYGVKLIAFPPICVLEIFPYCLHRLQCVHYNCLLMSRNGERPRSSSARKNCQLLGSQCIRRYKFSLPRSSNEPWIYSHESAEFLRVLQIRREVYLGRNKPKPDRILLTHILLGNMGRNIVQRAHISSVLLYSFAKEQEYQLFRGECENQNLRRQNGEIVIVSW